MLKALFRKQFLEMAQVLFFDRRKGRLRSPRGIAGLGVLFFLLYVCTSFAFFGIGDALGTSLLPEGLDWLYFGLMGGLCLLVATFVSCFATYSWLFRAKDNQFLLSLPIPAGYILLSRMASVVASCLLCSVMAWVPALIEYSLVMDGLGLTTPTGWLPVSLALLVPMTLLSVTLSCAVGWIVALIANRIKSKALVATVVTAVGLSVFYYIEFQAKTILEQVVQMRTQIADTFCSYAWPLFQLGLAATGDLVAFGLFSALSLVLLVVAYAALSATFERLATTQVSLRSKEKFDTRKMKVRTAERALLWRELKRFVTCTPYLVNCSIGIIVMVVAPIMVLINASVVQEMLVLMQGEASEYMAALPVLVAVAVCLLVCTSPISTSSVSLEGKTLWAVRSLPVDSWLVLRAKENMHILLCGVPAVFSTLVLSFVFGLGVIDAALCVAVSLAFTWLTAVGGLALDVRNPNLTWTNEVVPVKQNFSVVIVMLGGWVVCAAVLLAGGMVSLATAPEIALICAAALFGGLALLLQRWLKTKGVQCFEAL